MMEKVEMPVLTTNLITTAGAGYQHLTRATERNWLRRVWKTLLGLSLVITCAQIAIGHPHLTRLEEGYIKKIESKM